MLDDLKHRKSFSRSHLSRISGKRPSVITVMRKLLNSPFEHSFQPMTKQCLVLRAPLIESFDVVPLKVSADVHVLPESTVP